MNDSAYCPECKEVVSVVGLTCAMFGHPLTGTVKSQSDSKPDEADKPITRCTFGNMDTDGYRDPGCPSNKGRFR